MQGSPPPQTLVGVWDSPQPQQATFPVHGAQMGFFPKTNASTALTLSILGLALGVMCFPLCGLLAIPGLIMGQSSLNVTKSMPGHPDSGAARAAQVIGIITIGLMLLSLAFIVVLVMLETQGGNDW